MNCLQYGNHRSCLDFGSTGFGVGSSNKVNQGIGILVHHFDASLATEHTYKSSNSTTVRNSTRLLDNIMENETAASSLTLMGMGLAPELRNMIYYELLTLQPHTEPGKGMFCWPHFLCTSKQIYDEAREILCANGIEIEFVQKKGGNFYGSLSMRINHRPVNHSDQSFVTHALLNWPR